MTPDAPPTPARHALLAQWLLRHAWHLPISLDRLTPEVATKILGHARELLDWQTQQGWLK